MPFGSYETPQITAPPTFLQYIRTCGKGVVNKTKFAVEIIWLPGKFDNVTLQTHSFRYICNSDHPLYEDVLQWCDTLEPGANLKRLDIIITSINDKTIQIEESSQKQVTWTTLGKNAIKFTEI